MFKTIRRALEFMSPLEQSRYFFLLALTACVGIFDLVGILAIGFLATSIALFVTLGSDATRVIEFAGQRIPAITAGTLPFVSVAILTLFIVKAVLSILLTKQLAFFLAAVEARAAREVADRAFGNGLEDARRLSRDEVYFAVQGGSPAAFNTSLNAVGTIAAEGLLFVFVIGSFLVVDAPSAIGALAYFGLIALVIQYFIGTRLQRTAEEVARGSISGDQAIGDLSEVLREATVYGSKEFFFQKIFDARSRTASNLASQHTLSAMPRYIVETALIIAVALFVLVQASSGDLVKAAGTVGIFLSGGLRLTASLLPLQGALLSIRQSMPIAEKALSLLEEDGKTVSATHVSTSVSRKPKYFEPVGVEMKNVSFGFIGASQFAIRNISLRVEAGQQVALIGPSGAGKSTIADLILGLLIPTSGEISVDGLSPRAVILETPGRLAYVPQRPGIISGTLTENIAMGSSKGDLDLIRLESAIKNSHLEEVLEGLPDGVESNVGKRKDELSGGQLQRIGLARALYSRPGLLIMDEATSALDAESENEINKALDEMRGRTTVVLIAHRLNTVQRSDLVFLVEDGQITASGKFRDLLESNKTIQKLADLMSIDSNNY